MVVAMSCYFGELAIGTPPFRHSQTNKHKTQSKGGVFKVTVPQIPLLSELKSIMFLSILVCVLLGALHAQAEVVSTFNDCNYFFYKETEPRGMSQNTKKICQYYGNVPDPRYASLYSEHHRIPLYSAYIFNRGCSSSPDKQSFFIEPQLYDINEDRRMRPEVDFKSKVNQIKENQAINEYYKHTGYDRGHLNPNSFQCGDSRDATFTLTNAAPMDACFNRVQWHQWESKVKEMLTSELKDSPSATPFLVTGIVPHSNYRIPRKEESDQDELRDYEKVTVPSHVWTALCFAHPTDEEK
ncbi:hypothetical protein NFI96_030536 [Prochilodus magdalenae]|nr:hypothetical protein NFI96_030536 [Prochilodus magdalenae]